MATMLAMFVIKHEKYEGDLHTERRGFVGSSPALCPANDLLIQQSDAVWSELLKAPLNKPRVRSPRQD
jgi:hypothetical protein